MHEKKGYEKLEVYERSYKAGLAVYRMTRTYPKEEIYAMTDQMRRASVSIPRILLKAMQSEAVRKNSGDFC